MSDFNSLLVRSVSEISLNNDQRLISSQRSLRYSKKHRFVWAAVDAGAQENLLLAGGHKGMCSTVRASAGRKIEYQVRERVIARPFYYTGSRLVRFRPFKSLSLSLSIHSFIHAFILSLTHTHTHTPPHTHNIKSRRPSIRSSRASEASKGVKG